MSDSPATRSTLLLRLSDRNDRQAWEQFVEIYAPLVFQLARRRGLQDSDAADIVQEVLIRLNDAFRRGKHDRTRGSFRGWLRTITTNEIHDWLSQRARREAPTGGSAAHEAFANVSATHEDETWDREYEERLFSWAAERVKEEVQPSTWQAFWQTAIDQRSGEEVSASVGISVAAVYLAKSRIMKRIRELVRDIDNDLDHRA